MGVSMNEQIARKVYEERWQKIQNHLEEKDKDIFITRNPGNVRYLSCAHIPSFPLLNHVLVDRDGHMYGITSSLEQFRAMEEAEVDELKIFSPYPGIRSDGKTGLAVLKELIREQKWKNALSDTKVPTRLVRQETSGFIEDMRIVKSPDEIAYIKTACKITDLAAAELREMAVPGVTERHVARKLNSLLREDERVQTNSFETIVAGGPKSAFSHHDVTGRKLKKGDMVIIDFGVYVNGYCSDCTRTISVGEASREMKEVYDLVLEGQQNGIALAKKGEAYGVIDKSIRDLFAEKDLHKHFVHSTGHGIGLEVHEAPNGIRFDMKKKMENGHVFTVEPGIYIPGKGGVRIEDDILIENGLPVVLTKAERCL